MGKIHRNLGSYSEKTVTMMEAIMMRLYLLRRFGWTVAWKAFCITASGLIALVPPLSKKVLVHIRGGCIPFVFRPTGPGERRSELVGTCTPMVWKMSILVRFGRIGCWNNS